MNKTDRLQFINEHRGLDYSWDYISNKLGLSRQRIWQILNPDRLPSKIKPINKIKIWTKRKREHLGLPLEVTYKSGGLDFVREMVRIRDNHTCQKCFKVWIKGQRRFDVHHLDIKQESVKDINYDRNNMDKMITYCHKCHLNLHTVRQKMANSKAKRYFSPVGK